MKKRIALIYGGASEEHNVSLMGYEYVSELLMANGYDVISVYIDRDGRWSCNGSTVFPFPCDVGVLKEACGNTISVDAAIPLLHGDGGESGEIQGLLSAAKIPFVGSDASTGAVCLDKHYTKCIAKNLGVPVVDWICFPKNVTPYEALYMCENALRFPVFIKPRRLGSSIGAFVAKGREEFLEYFPKAYSVGSGLIMAESLVENKRELECAYYGTSEKTVISPPGEILTDGFYGYDEKYVKSAKIEAVANVNEDIRDTAKQYSRALAKICGLRHLGRIDFFLTDGRLVFNEINTFPGFTSQSLYPKMLNAMGIPPKEALRSFIEDAIGC